MDSQVVLLQKELRNRAYVFENRKILFGLLNDCFPNEKAKVNQLIAAYDCGIVFKALDTNMRNDFFRTRLISEIRNNHGYDNKTAEWITDTWLFCVDDNLMGKYKKHLEEKKEATIEPTSSPRSEKLEEDEPLFQLSDSIIPEGFFIPCGVGSEDGGFAIRGIRQAKECTHIEDSLFAILFNYLQRNTTIDEKHDKPYFIKQYEKKLPFETDYRKVFRLMIIILLLVRNNYNQSDLLSFDYDGETEEIKTSFLCINNYLALLCRLSGIKDIVKLRYQKNPNFRITLRDKLGNVSISDYKGNNSNRIIWDAKKIIYHISDDSKEDLEYILAEISPYSAFNAGQFEALRDMLNTQAHTVCIMPTGSGKSLIFYLCSILQPGVSFVISPTELLINDQIENLKKYHKYNDVKHLKYGEDDDFSNFIPKYKVYYLTPETFQSRDLLKEFILLNSNKKIANIILDEVHCISNWSHDFRPEYLMLSTYLNKYLDRTFYKCFTATANYTVIKDIKIQLQISDDKNIISPVKLEKSNIKFTFLACDDTEIMINNSVQFLRKNIIKGQKTLVFTKNETVSRFLYNALDDVKYDTVVYSNSDRTAYKTFSKGQCKILIASDELGVGINLADVHNVLHFGLPISKGEFVQEIGRAGRNGEQATSLVVYLKCVTSNVQEQLLLRNTSTKEVLDIISDYQEQNDYANSYKKLMGSIRTQDEFSTLLTQVYETIKPIIDFDEIDFSLGTIDNTKKCLFVLFTIGFVNNWSYCEINNNANTVKMLIAVKKANQSLNQIKEKTRDYLYVVGGDKKSISLINSSTSIEEIICIYLDWYYNHFIYHHKEQFLDMLAFFESYKSEDKEANYSKEIINRLAAYFSLSMLEISQDEAKYANLSFKNIAETVISGIDYTTVSNIQRINQDNNNIKLDYFLFIYSLVCDGEYDESRITRILVGMEDDGHIDFFESISIAYEKVDTSNRFLLFKAISECLINSDFDFEIFFDMIYRHNKRDIIFYGVMAKKINPIIGGKKIV